MTQSLVIPGKTEFPSGGVTKDFDWLYRRMRCDIDLHERAEYTCEFGEKDWVHQGFNLDKEVLRKLYYDNPNKVFGR